MSQSKINVPQFSVDHRTLEPGLYLRSIKRVGLFSKVKVWELCFVAPRSKAWLNYRVLHTIEHIMALKLRSELGKKYISFSVMGCRTGFEFVSTGSLSYEQLRLAICSVIFDSVPILSKEEIPCLTEKECGNPNLYCLVGASTALQDYYEVLTGLEGRD